MRCAAAAGLVSATVLLGASSADGAALAVRTQAGVVVGTSWLLPHNRVVVARAAKVHSVPRSCAAHRWRGVWGAESRLLPVACEQPPRSNLLLQLHNLSWLALLGW